MPDTFHRRCALLAAVSITLGTAGLSQQVSSPGTKSVSAGSTWVVNGTARLRRLEIAANATITAPAGYSLTMTVNGVETAIHPGTYQGDVVLTGTRDVLVKYLPDEPPYHYRSAIYVSDGQYMTDKSVAAAVSTGQVDNTSARGVTINSKGEDFNGIVVTGDSTYTVDHPTIEMQGNGGNDFAGFGAAILSSGRANVTVNDAHISTQGAIRTAVFVGGHSTMTVNHSFLEVRNGTLPPNHPFTVMPGRMMEVPYGLGISGNVRATNLIESGTVYYNDSHIRAQAWGALSSDGDEPTRMFATNTLVETVESGYGAYADGQAQDHFSHCTFNVADYGLIAGGNGSATFTGGTVVNSRRFGVMMHQGTGGSRLIIEKGSVFNTQSTAIEIKGRGANIFVDDAELHPRNGVLLQTMDNDDPIMKELAVTGMKLPAGMPGFEGTHPAFSSDVNATFRAVTLQGDMIHAMKNHGELNVNLLGAKLTGSITSATASPASGTAPTRETFRTIGDVTNTFGPADGPNGVNVFLDGTSAWTIQKTSYLNQLTAMDGAAILAASGNEVRMTVDGVETPLKAGTYSGAIVLAVVPTR